MNKISLKAPVFAAIVLSAAILGALLVYVLAMPAPVDKSPVTQHLATGTESDILYWYDPMYPAQHFDKPGKSPFMDMDLVPKYANGQDDVSGIRIAPEVTQQLGMRLAIVESISNRQQLSLSGRLTFNERLRHILQLRSPGFVERVWPLAVGDKVKQGQPLVELLMPDWASAQYELLAVAGTAELQQAARRRLVLLGMPEDMIKRVETNKAVETHWTLRAPIDGVIEAMDVRFGMTLSAGQTLARIIGTETLWLETAIPEAQADDIRQGHAMIFHPANAALPPVEGRFEALLPMLNAATRTVTARAVVSNPDGDLFAGLTGRVTWESGSGQHALAIPTEAVIYTGKRALVMLADEEGQFTPQEISVSREVGAMTIVASGLSAGQQVVASGQFLLDSEASLLGITAQPDIEQTTHDHPEHAAPDLHEAVGVILAITPEKVRLKHGPFKSLSMPGMAMSFPLATPQLAADLNVGDQVQVSVRETEAGLLVEALEKLPREVHP